MGLVPRAPHEGMDLRMEAAFSSVVALTTGAKAAATSGCTAHVQVEFYFSDENLPTDAFLMKEVRKTAEGWGARTLGMVAERGG